MCNMQVKDLQVEVGQGVMGGVSDIHKVDDWMSLIATEYNSVQNITQYYRELHITSVLLELNGYEGLSPIREG